MQTLDFRWATLTTSAFISSGNVGQGVWKVIFKKQSKLLLLFTETGRRVETLWVILVIFHANDITKPFKGCFLEGFAGLLSQMVIHPKTYCAQRWVIDCMLTSNCINSKCVLVWGCSISCSLVVSCLIMSLFSICVWSTLCRPNSFLPL